MLIFGVDFQSKVIADELEGTANAFFVAYEQGVHVGTVPDRNGGYVMVFTMASGAPLVVHTRKEPVVFLDAVRHADKIFEARDAQGLWIGSTPVGWQDLPGFQWSPAQRERYERGKRELQEVFGGSSAEPNVTKAPLDVPPQTGDRRDHSPKP